MRVIHVADIRPSLWTLILAMVGVLGTVACQTDEQGYWTKQDMSQALTNEQYPSDSRHCDAIAANDTTGRSEQYKATLYAKCMQAQGYQWVIEHSQSNPSRAAENASAQIPPCPTGRLIIDSFGYHKCVPAGGKDRGISIESVSKLPLEAVSTPALENQPFLPNAPPNERWSQDHQVCRQYAKDSLSSPYSVYTHCMQDKGWSPGS